MNLTKDEELLVARMHERREINKPKVIDNAKLPAGSPMYYYCKCCYANVAVLPELHNSAPPRFCDACQYLKNRGLA